MKRTFSKLFFTIFLLSALTLVLASCGKLDNKISFKTLTLDESNNVYAKLPNGTATFSFLNEVEAIGNASYGVYLDIGCSKESKSKTVKLKTGDNIFYIWAEGTDAGDVLYTVNVRVKPMYEVTFNSNGGTSIENQLIEEDAFASIPSNAPTKEGYTFASWDFDFTTPITESKTVNASWTANTYTVTFDKNGGTDGADSVSATYDDAMPTASAPTRTGYTFHGYFDASNVKYYNADMTSARAWDKTTATTLYAKWRANTNTPYTVKHYQQNILDDDYTLFEVQNLKGTSDSTVKPAFKTYAGFTSPPTTRIAKIEPDGSLVVNYYYRRNSYTLTVVGNGGTSVAMTQKYGSAIDTSSVTRSGYELGGLYTDINLSSKITTIPSEDTTVYAYWLGESKPSDFNYSNRYQVSTEIAITGYKGTPSSLVIPQYIGGKKVTSIGNYAFSGCSSLDSITIPESVTIIGDYVFSGCSSLESITIPESVTIIGDYVFSSCSSLESISVASGNTVYHSDGNCLIETATNTLIRGCKNSIIPSNGTVTSIASYAFTDCTALNSITIPETITSIGEYAFRGCTILESIIIPSNVTSIGTKVFYNCTSLTSIKFDAASTWYRTTSSSNCENKTGGTETDVTDSSNNATYFKSSYCNCYWYKK